MRERQILGHRQSKKRSVKTAWLCLPLLPVVFLLFLDWDRVQARAKALGEEPMLFVVPAPAASPTDAGVSKTAPLQRPISPADNRANRVSIESVVGISIPLPSQEDRALEPVITDLAPEVANLGSPLPETVSPEKQSPE